jgi:hypothetical protein
LEPVISTCLDKRETELKKRLIDGRLNGGGPLLDGNDLPKTRKLPAASLGSDTIVVLPFTLVSLLSTPVPLPSKTCSLLKAGSRFWVIHTVTCEGDS